MRLSELVSPDLIFPNVPGSDRPTALRAMAERLSQLPSIGSCDDLYRRLWEREELGTTAIGRQVAVPHCKVEGLGAVIVAVGISENGVDFGSEDGLPVRLLFVVVSPEESPAEHLQSLSAISKWVRENDHVERVLSLSDPQEIGRLIREEVG
ncbi:MAG: PTS sugar transporter subunit IIA [Acidobacteriota bacterium]